MSVGLCALSISAEKVIPRRLRGVCQIGVFMVRKLIVFSGQIVCYNGDTIAAPMSLLSLCHFSPRFLIYTCLFYTEVVIASNKQIEFGYSMRDSYNISATINT